MRKLAEWLGFISGYAASFTASVMPRSVVIAVLARACREWSIATRDGELALTVHPYDARVGHFVSFQHSEYGIHQDDQVEIMMSSADMFTRICGLDPVGPSGSDFNIIDYLDRASGGEAFKIEN